jgi:hypothetical protein
MMDLSKPASSPRATTPHPAGARCQAARRVDGVVEASKLLARCSPTPGRSRMPDGCPQSSGDGAVEADELYSRRRPTPGRGRMPDGCPQSADDGAFEASELPAGLCPHPAGCRTAARRVQMMELTKPASSQRATPHPWPEPDARRQSEDAGVVEASELSTRSYPTPSWMPDAGWRPAECR